MESRGELTPPPLEERIKQAAIGRLLDAELGNWDGRRENLASRDVTYMLETDNPQAENALSIVHIISNGSLNVAVTQFRENLGYIKPMDLYQVTGFTAIIFPDPFSLEATEGNVVTPFGLDVVAEVLEDQKLEELNLDTLSGEKGVGKAVALSTANAISHRLWTARSKDSVPNSKAKRISSKLRRILKI